MSEVAGIDHRQLTLMARPHRLAYIVPEDSTFRQAIIALQHMSSFWDGFLTILIPVSQARISPVFLRQLELFDPDFVSTPLQRSQIPDEVVELVSNKLGSLHRQAGKVVEYNWPRINQLTVYPSLDRVAKDRSASVLNIEFDDTWPNWLQAYFYSCTGVLDEPNLQRCIDAEIDVDRRQYSLDPANLYLLLDLIEGKSRAEEGDEARTPFDILHHGCVGYYRIFESETDKRGNPLEKDTTTIVVAGQTFANFCLYHNLLRLCGRVRWYPYPRRWRCKYFWQMVAERITDSWTQNVVLCSATLGPKALYRVKSRLVDTIANSSPIAFLGGRGDSTSEGHQIAEGIRKKKEGLRKTIQGINSVDIPPYYVEHVLADAPRHTLQFVGGQAVKELEPPLPSISVPQNSLSDYQWVTQIEVAGYWLPQRLCLIEGHVDVPGNLQPRLTRRGLAYQALSSFRLTGEDVARLQIRPRISLLPPERIFQTLFNNGGCSIELSDKSNFFRIIIERLESLENLAQLLRDRESMKLFEVLRKLNRLNFAGMSKALGLSKRADTREDFAGRLELWLQKRLLQMGFVLGCRQCFSKDWYSLSDLGEGFRCHRCGHHQIVLPEPTCCYRLDGVFQKFLEQNEDVVALALASLKQGATTFIYLPERKVFRSGGKEPFMEVDFVLIRDGKFFIGEAKKDKGSKKKIKDMVCEYTQVACDIGVDVVVFATRASDWGTLREVVEADGDPSVQYMLLDRKHLLGSSSLPEPIRI